MIQLGFVCLILKITVFKHVDVFEKLYEICKLFVTDMLTVTLEILKVMILVIVKTDIINISFEQAK